VKLLLEQPGIEVNGQPQPGMVEVTDFPIWMAANRNHQRVVELILASKHKLVVKTQPMIILRPPNAAEKLVTMYQMNPEETRLKMRETVAKKWHYPGKLLFLISFVADGYLEIDQDKESRNPYLASEEKVKNSTKFLNIVCSLPLEIKEAICHRCFRLKNNFLEKEDREKSFSEAIHYLQDYYY